MVMWKKELDPYVTVHISESASYLPIVIDIPGWTPMIHCGVYLPTAGKETEFLTELVSLRNCIEELQTKFPTAAVFIRGDSNASKTNVQRNNTFSNFCSDLHLARIDLNHNSFHHFVGNGAADS